jgi:hypothetical protein
MDDIKVSRLGAVVRECDQLIKPHAIRVPAHNTK